MTAPVLDYKPREACAPRWPAFLLLAWSAFDILAGLLVTFTSAVASRGTSGREAVIATACFLVGALLTIWGLIASFVGTRILQQRPAALQSAHRHCLIAEILTHIIWAALFAMFFYLDNGWTDAGRIKSYSLGLVCTYPIPASTTLTRILIRRASRIAARAPDASRR